MWDLTHVCELQIVEFRLLGAKFIVVRLSAYHNRRMLLQRSKGETVVITCSFGGEVKRAYKIAFVGKSERKTSWKT
jgi:hypothetical protein